ncbi:hypothetical protein BJX65DRAFT_301831 [Aspergillus insuetus]
MPAPSHQYQANYQPIGWVHDPILRDNYGAATQVPITDANAQQNLPAEARILVGNLPVNCDPEVLRDQLKGVFPYFGLNWVHIENRCKHTVAVVQFHARLYPIAPKTNLVSLTIVLGKNFQQADQAIAHNQGINYYGRPLRIELSKAGRIRRNKIVEPSPQFPD